ncbi:MAG: carbohydrate kinase family protein, partial [Acidobacteriales bacterium]|nr:carbohydrate kinase family protein [Terriglobales bacterium]
GYPSLDFIMPVSHSPRAGETALLDVVLDEVEPLFGGCGANVAVGLRRLGLNTGIAMIVGDDEGGDLYRSYLAAQQVDQQDVIVVPEAKTSRSYLFRNPRDEYQNFFFPGAADQWRDTLCLKRRDGLRYALVTVGPYRYNRQFVEQVRQASVPLVWQLKSDIFAFPVDAIQSFARASTIILMNHLEAEFVRRSLGLNSLNELIRGNTTTLVVTQGAHGAVLSNVEGRQKISICPVQVTDTTGAGDGFATGFLAGLLKGYAPIACAQLGSVAASFVLEKVGCQTNLPDWEQTLSRYRENFGAL